MVPKILMPLRAILTEQKFARLVGLHTLHKLGQKRGKERTVWCRDKGLSCFEKTCGQEAQRIRKEFIKLFTNVFNLNIVCEINLKPLNFLDLTLNLPPGEYEPYSKLEDKPLSINLNSGHPPNILKNLPEIISRRIYKLSSYRTVFNNSKELFSNTLSYKEFDYKVKFQPRTENKDYNRNRNKGRKIVCFTHPPPPPPPLLHKTAT